MPLGRSLLITNAADLRTAIHDALGPGGPDRVDARPCLLVLAPQLFTG